MVKRHLSLDDIGRLLSLDGGGVRTLIAREPLLRVVQIKGQTVVPVTAWRRWVRDVNESALASLTKEPC